MALNVVMTIAVINTGGGNIAGWFLPAVAFRTCPPHLAFRIEWKPDASCGCRAADQ